MAVSIGEICAEVHNYFVNANDIYNNEFQILDGTITPSDFLLKNQFFRVKGSILNDGVYCNNAEGTRLMLDETFTGQVWAMRVPEGFVKLVNNISAWDDKYGGVNSSNMSPYQSESYAGQYSYSKSSGGSRSGSAINWQSQFASQLARYRKVSEE